MIPCISLPNFLPYGYELVGLSTAWSSSPPWMLPVLLHTFSGAPSFHCNTPTSRMSPKAPTAPSPPCFSHLGFFWVQKVACWAALLRGEWIWNTAPARWVVIDLSLPLPGTLSSDVLLTQKRKSCKKASFETSTALLSLAGVSQQTQERLWMGREMFQAGKIKKSSFHYDKG